VSAAALSGLEPIATAAAGGGEPIATTAAAARIQQLQALLAQVEHGPTGGSSNTFASALDAAQAGGKTSTTASAYASSAPIADAAYTAATPPAGSTVAAAIEGCTATPPTPVAHDSATPTSAGTAGGGSAYAPLIEQAAARYGLDPSVLYGLIEQESGFDPSATSSAGALGLTQLMPSTAASLGVTEPLDPAQSIEGGARYLSQLLQQFAGNTTDALAAYNAGPGAVAQYGGVPPYPETRQYVAKVLGYAASYSQSGQDRGAAVLPTSTAPIAGGAAAAPASEAIV
jgi:soluble lytic murein transglycosylase-like protein